MVTTRERYFILDSIGNVLPEPLFKKWAQWMEDSTLQRQIALSKVEENVEVSTVFTGLDNNYQIDGPPLLFETRVFGGKCDGYTERYAALDEACIGHDRICRMVDRSKQRHRLLIEEEQ